MESKHGYGQIIFLLLITLSSVLISCNSSGEKEIIDLPDEFSFLEEGDIVCRLGNGYFSGIFRRLSENDQRFSHVGIITKKTDSLFVIHAEASEFTGIGKVKKETLSDFLNHSKDHSFFRLKDSLHRERVSEKACVYLEQEIPFDMDFDHSSDSTVYCSEMVANCINFAVQKNAVNPASQINGKWYYSIENISSNEEIYEIKPGLTEQVVE